MLLQLFDEEAVFVLEPLNSLAVLCRLLGALLHLQFQIIYGFLFALQLQPQSFSLGLQSLTLTGKMLRDGQAGGSQVIVSST